METERARRLADFVSSVGANLRGDEKGEAQLVLDRMLRGFGHEGLPEAIRAGILAMVKAASGEGR
jgi:hypothetical protein